MEKIYIEIARRINDVLTAKGLTAESLAFQIGLSKSYMSRILSSRRRVSLHTLQKIAKGLGISIKGLFPEE